MNKELIDRAWAYLPREFKEKVKKKYARFVEIDADDNPNLPAYAVKSAISRMALLEKLFGIHNLTSDAEGEETLICEKSKVQRAYNTSREIVKAENPDTRMYSIHTQIMCVLESIFGTKCLPDEDVHEDNFTSIEPKPAETKNEGTRQEQCVPKNAESGTHSFSHILKDSFQNERRLNIAAQIVASMIGSDDWTTWRGGSNKEIWHNMAKSSLEIADALIAECEKGGIK